MASSLATGAKVSSKSIPSCWAYPLQTSLALFLITSPFSFNLFLKIHFVPMTFLSFGLGTNSQVLFFLICSSYSSIALTQHSSLHASITFCGSVEESNAK